MPWIGGFFPSSFPLTPGANCDMNAASFNERIFIMPNKHSTRDAGRKLARKERERRRHRREILDAAEAVFVRKGYAAATVDEIAQEAEFAVGTLYNFFQGKDDLYAHVMRKIVEDFMEAFETQVLSLDDPIEAITALIELRLTHFDEHWAFFRVFLETSPVGLIDTARVLPATIVEQRDRYLRAVSRLFEDGVARGAFDEIDPLYLTLCLEGMINAFFSYWFRHKPTEPLAVRVEKMTAAFLGRGKIRPADHPPAAGSLNRKRQGNKE